MLNFLLIYEYFYLIRFISIKTIIAKVLEKLRTRLVYDIRKRAYDEGYFQQWMKEGPSRGEDIVFWQTVGRMNGQVVEAKWKTYVGTFCDAILKNHWLTDSLSQNPDFYTKVPFIMETRYKKISTKFPHTYLNIFHKCILMHAFQLISAAIPQNKIPYYHEYFSLFFYFNFDSRLIVWKPSI